MRVSDRENRTTAIALLAGTFSAIQPKLNAELGTRLDSSITASLLNFLGAFTIGWLVVSRRPATRRTLRALRSVEVPWWTFTAGLGGVTVVLIGVVAVDRIGVAIFSVAFFAGQIAAGLVLDRFGVSVSGRRRVTAARVDAVVLALIAVAVAQVGRDAGEARPGYIALAIAGGAAVSLQSGFNGRITAETGDAAVATAVNVTVGTSALVVAFLASGTVDDVGSMDWPAEPWLYAGGLLGVTVVLSLAHVTASLGVVRATIAMLSAQMVTAVAVDWIIDDAGPTAGVVAGSVLITVAVVRSRMDSVSTVAAGRASDE